MNLIAPDPEVNVSDVVVGILVGSESDRERMQAAFDELDARGIALGVRGAVGAPRRPTRSPSTRARRPSAGCRC